MCVLLSAGVPYLFSSSTMGAQMLNVLAIAAACGYLYAPGPEWDAKPLPAIPPIVVEVPYREMRFWCKSTNIYEYGCSYVPTFNYVYVPSKDGWPGTEECRLEAWRHEMAHAKGATHADMVDLRRRIGFRRWDRPQNH